MRKVLATTMAGAMIFGMSSAAFAATSLDIKPYNSGSYDYTLDLWIPSDEYTTETTGYEIKHTASTLAAFEDFERAYNYYEGLDNLDDYKDYFKASGNVAKSFTDFYNVAKNDNSNTGATVFAKLETAVTGLDEPADIKSTAVPLNDGTSNTTYALYSATAAENLGKGVNTEKWDGATVNVIDGLLAKVDAAKIRKALLKETSSTSVNPDAGSYDYENKGEASIDKNDFTLYNYSEDDEINVRVLVAHGDSLRLDVNSGKVTATRKKMDSNKEYDEYKITIKPNWDVKDLVDDNDDLFSYKLEVDIESNNEKAKDPGTFYIKGKGAYSDFQMVEPDDRLQVLKSDKTPDNDRGCAFVFDQKLTSETRIKANQYVDVYMKGNYGTDIENLRVLTDADEVKEIEDFFEDVDIDYYDFIGVPKFATEVTLLIDGDANSYLYEFDKKTGEIENITDSAEYTSDGWKFKRKNLKTYVLMEEEYNGGNVKADKEEIIEEEPEASSEPEVSEPAVDNVDTNAKPNPGTGAYPAL